MSVPLALPLTLLSAAAGGALFSTLSLPLPWMLGAIFGVIALSRTPMPLMRPPRWMLNPARAVLGLAIGTAFQPSMLDQLTHYAISLVFVLPFVVIVGGVGTWYFHRVVGLSRTTAFLSALPGGLAELILLGEEVGADVRKVALIQGTRILVLVYTLPFLAGFLTDTAVGTRPQVMPNLLDIAPVDVVVLTAIAAGGWIIVRQIGLSGAAIIGPLVLAGIATITGVLDQRPPDGLFKAGQLILGASVGSIFIGYSVRKMMETALSSLGYLVLLGALTFGVGYTVANLTDFSLVSALLAFAPGGQAETSVIALTLGEDAGYVALHHLLRLVLIVSIIPMLMRVLFQRTQGASDIQD